MTTKIVWRLKERPTPSEIIELKKAGLLKEDEAREILFSSETEEDRDKKSLEAEIIFLRKMVEKLAAGNNQTIISTIHDCHRPHYDHYPWYGQYQVWCANLQSGLTGSTGITNASYQNMTTEGTSALNAGMASTSLNAMSLTSGSGGNEAMQSASFSNIKTW